MERMWLGDAKMKYPKQWLVAINLEWEPKSKLIGDIFLVTPDEDEAYAKAIELKINGNMGKVTVVEGYNDTPQIGGLWVCNQ